MPIRNISFFFGLAGMFALGTAIARVNVWTTSGPNGGEISALAVSPSNPSIIYAGIQTRGVYQSVDRASTWVDVGGGLPNKNVRALAVDPQNPAILYVGTSDRLYKSINSGQTWSECPLAISDSNRLVIAIDSLHPSTLYAGNGVVLSKSIDGGLTWIPLTFPSKSISSIVINPQDPAILFVGAFSDRNWGIGDIYKSTNGGIAWTPAGISTNIQCLAIDLQTPTTIYAGDAYFFGNLAPYGRPKGPLKSIDGGITWTTNPNYEDDYEQPGLIMVHQIAIDPANPLQLYATDWNNWIEYLSVDGGIRWEKKTNSMPVRWIQIAPGNPSSLYAGNRTGVFKSTDVGATWRFASFGINKAPISALSVYPPNSSVVFAAGIGGIYKSIDQGKTWVDPLSLALVDKDVCSVAVDPQNENIIFAGMNIYRGLWKSVDGGQTWELNFKGETGNYMDQVFKSLVFDPSNSQTIYAGTNNALYKSVDGGSSWTTLLGPTYLNIGVDSLAINPLNPQNLFVWWEYGLLQSVNGGKNWNGVVGLPPPCGSFNTEPCPPNRVVVFDPSNPSIVYAGIHTLYKSLDGGAHWTRVTDFFLEKNGIERLAFDPQHPSRIFTANSFAGVFMSPDGGETWAPLLQGLSNLSIQDLALSSGSPTVLHAGTAEGVFSITWQAMPFLSVDRAHLVFASFDEGSNPNPQIIRIVNKGDGYLDWAVTSYQQGWLHILPTTGHGDGWISVSVDLTKKSLFSQGKTLEGVISIMDSAALNSPLSIDVTWNIYAAGETQPPFGSFDTPVEGSTGVTGAIPVTGWVLDDIEVTKVEIWRDAFAGETAGIWKIGDPIFVEGARPDVEQAYPDYPLSYRAGWGYMLLTNMLPNHGNGTYKLYAYAYDKDGNKVLLGIKTISCDNAHAEKPFGAIDSPAQGETISLNPYLNFGWVLTPLTKTMPKDGSTIDVYVDSIKVGNLGTAPNLYNQYRVDVSTGFPGLNNTGEPGGGGPVGAYFLDTTKYPNGVHTIAWVATDDAGAADGIGSRYFNIFNPGTAVQVSSELVNLEKVDSYESIMNLPVSFELAKAKRGFNLKGDPEVLQPDNYGIIHIEIREVERIEVDLGKSRDYRGYLVVGEKMRPLPIGSTLDSTKGTFSWMPGPGFFGTYELVLIAKEGIGITRRIPITVKIRPKFEKR